MSTDADADPPAALPRGMRLGEFEIRRVLGIGGFGIVYLAFDHALEREVALKEYMPSSLAGRTDKFHVSLRSQGDAETFALGLRSFINEARLLARFDNPALVKVYRFWEDYGTAYMAMPYYTGENLKAVRQRMSQQPDEAWIRAILLPLLSAIELLHNDKIYHRDISPDNVIVQPDGRPVLLDLGAARRVISDKSMALTAILKPAYAPIEQYAEAGAVKQGPWTDLYSLGATVYFLLFARAPSPATTRAVHDDMVPLVERGAPGCSAAFLACVDWMLRPRPTERPQSVPELRQMLLSGAMPPLAPQPGNGSWDRTQVVNPPAAPSTQALELDLTAPLPRPVAPSAGYDPTLMMSAPTAAAPPPTVVMPAPTDGGANHEATLVVPRPGHDDYAPTMRVGAPASARPAAQALVAESEVSISHEPRLAPRKTWAMPALVGVVGVAAAAAWFAFKPPTPKPSTAAAPPAASAVAPAATTAAPAAAAVPASGPVPALTDPESAAAKTGPPATAKRAPAPATTPPTTATAARPEPKSAPATTATPAGGQPTARKEPSIPPYMPPPLPTAGSASRPGNAGSPAGGREPSSSGTATAQPAAPADFGRPAPTSSNTGSTQALAPPPAATGAANPATTAGGGSRPAEAEPVLRTRLLSPSERCGGRVLLALWNCIERQCSRSPELKDHPECVEARQHRERRSNP